MNYGPLFSKIRKSRRISQKSVSSGILSQSMLSRFETTGKIEADVLVKLLHRLHIHPTEFFMLSDDADFLRQQFFYRRLHAAFFNFSDYILLSNEERDKYRETNDIYHLINAVRIEAIYAYKHNKNFSSINDDIEIIKKHLLSMDSWFESEIVLYLDIMFIFDDSFIKSQHRRMIRSLESLPFGTSHRNYLKSAYGHNSTILAFERGSTSNIAFYLSYFESTLTKDPRDLTNAFYYSVYQQLLNLKMKFNQDMFISLFQEIKLLQKYGYEDEYAELKKFITKNLSSD